MTPGTVCEIAGRDGEVWTLERDIVGGWSISYDDGSHGTVIDIPAEVLAAFAKVVDQPTRVRGALS